MYDLSGAVYMFLLAFSYEKHFFFSPRCGPCFPPLHIYQALLKFIRLQRYSNIIDVLPPPRHLPTLPCQPRRKSFRLYNVVKP